MPTTSPLTDNLLSPAVLAFVLGLSARLVKGDLSLPKDAFGLIAAYLLFAIGLKGGVELAHAPAGAVAGPALVTLLLGCLTPVTAYLVLRKFCRLGAADAAGVAAHYGSVSAVTFIAAQAFVAAQGAPAEGFMPTLVTVLESPGINIALAIGLMAAGGGRRLSTALHEVFTSRGLLLLIGGLVVGLVMGEKNWADVALFYDTKGPVFRGSLCLFLLHMGALAGERLADLKSVGPRLLAFAVGVPVAHGGLGVWLGHLSGLSVGGAAVLGAMAASASYIAAPPAVRLTLPEANPTYSLTCALGVTFPFNILVGIPLYYEMARRMGE
ncbi:sodium-dependent bicarbonate transport family permease [Frigoriglobus tundricola]|uniref:Putative sodium-dependent bicarbonate transporter n=1 Tax=Frigoriglobus tundricola TaxID=2774151 RepID=A0A6M5YQU5_9BACT|nr:sodium-dependent bicarbonate transport family permease [Frigoriglobus tundricola]QJW96359.1 putative sodium-dependent bicarbonate transporter [Frigoriglobus tundricola]